MRGVYSAAGPALQLAWSASVDEDQRFQRILRNALLGLLVLAVVVPLIPLPELQREELEKLPPQLAKVVLEKKPLPKQQVKPVPVIEKPKPKKEVKPKPQVKKEQPKKIAKPSPKLNREAARQKAATSGLLQFQDDLQAMRDSVDLSKMQGRNITQGAATAKRLDRSVITSKAKVSSGGINTAALSRDTGGVALSGRETTKVKSQLASAEGRNPRASQNSREQSSRSDESIRKVMDRNKGAIFSIYNRALRKDPALQGKVTVKLVIEPSGQISSLNLVSSELQSPSLEKKLLARIRLILFGAEDVTRTTLNYSFDFLPY
jgi:outer membrane biosynthesis protein TonB